MSPVRRPSMTDRSKSSPLSLGTMPSDRPDARNKPLPKLSLDVLTPPSSPRHARSSSDLSNRSDDSTSNDTTDSQWRDGGKINALKPATTLGLHTADGILICPYDVEVLKDTRDRDRTFGYGAWSTVYLGTCHHKPTSGLMTPPLSPAAKPPVLVAVKQPSRKDAKAILESEARILSLLMSTPGHKKYIVSFYGIVQSTSSLVLAAMPLSLDEHIRKSAVLAQKSRTTWNMAEPVIGNTAVWLDLACKLISALVWLHESAMVVHGDIKPGNVLLERLPCGEEGDASEGNTHFLYQPVFADFTSSQRLNSEPTLNTLSAITREYTAPELLSSKVLRNPNSTATKESDVFSLAVTLLVSASGNPMVYSGSVFQRQAMATQGWMVIQAVRSGPMEEGARVPKQGVVERVLDQAVLRAGTGRIDACSWKSKIEKIIQGEPCKAAL